MELTPINFLVAGKVWTATPLKVNSCTEQCGSPCTRAAASHLRLRGTVRVPPAAGDWNSRLDRGEPDCPDRRVLETPERTARRTGRGLQLTRMFRTTLAPTGRKQRIQRTLRATTHSEPSFIRIHPHPAPHPTSPPAHPAAP